MASEPTRPVMLMEAGVEAAALLAALHKRAFTAAWDEDVFATMLCGPATAGFLASIEAAPAGFAVVQCAAGEAEVITLGVDPTIRRCGVGRELVTGLAAWAHGHGAQRVFLEVSEHNEAARALYAGCGFCEVGRRPGYYADGASALTCRLDLRP